MWCAHDEAGAGGEAAVLLVEPGDAEVDQLHVGVVVDQNVTGLHIAVDDADSVHSSEATGDLRAQGDSSFFVEGLVVGEGGEGLADDDLQGHPRRAEVFARGVHAHDVVVLDAREGPGFAQKAGAAFGVVVVVSEDFERHVSAEALVDRGVDLAHAAFTEGFAHDVAGDAGARHQAQRQRAARQRFAGGFVLFRGRRAHPPTLAALIVVVEMLDRVLH